MTAAPTPITAAAGTSRPAASERERHDRGGDRAPAPGGEGLQVPVGLGGVADGRNH